MHDLRNELKRARKDRGLTQASVALALGFSEKAQSRFSKYEKGRRKIPNKLIFPWALVVGLSEHRVVELMKRIETCENVSP